MTNLVVLRTGVGGGIGGWLLWHVADDGLDVEGGAGPAALEVPQRRGPVGTLSPVQTRNLLAAGLQGIFRYLY